MKKKFEFHDLITLVDTNFEVQSVLYKQCTYTVHYKCISVIYTTNKLLPWYIMTGPLQ